MKKLAQIISYILVAAVASIATLTVYTNVFDARQWAKLDEIKTLVDTRFIEEADPKAMEEAAAAAVIEALGDRWSYYMSAEEYRAYREQMANAYVGIGITITVREDGYIDVMKVDAGGPALEAGMLVGDIITAVEGQDISEMNIDQVKNMIRGEEGTQVSVTVLRGEETIILSITRKQIQTAVADGELLEDGIGLVSITNFDSRCKEETVKEIESLLAQGAQALIFDVRYNPGGYKTELVNLLDYLLPEGPLFRSEDYTGASFVDESDAKHLDIPMAVLVNGDSYSAAEFFAAALSEYDAAVVVGEPTTGKGHFQTSYELSDGSAIVISIGRYRTPDGISLDGTGLVPDIFVEVDDETYWQIYYGNVEPAEDPQIQAAVAVLKSE